MSVIIWQGDGENTFTRADGEPLATQGDFAAYMAYIMEFFTQRLSQPLRSDRQPRPGDPGGGEGDGGSGGVQARGHDKT